MISPVATVDSLREEVHGFVIVPGDETYDDARQTWNLSFNQYPAVILVAQNVSDVAKGIRYAYDHHLGIAVQSTGHGVIFPANDCFLIITSHLQSVTVDAQASTARIESGVMWGAVVEKAKAFGLIPLLGSSSHVGAVGYTLGGGMGWLARKYGLAADSVLEFEIVTAEGELLFVNEHENTDLFWALRGGGKGAFGVVTAMTIRLFPVTTVYAGSVIYPIEDAKEVFSFYREWASYLPTEWTTAITIMHYPPMPELPPFLSGRSVVMITGCYCGENVQLGQMMSQAIVDWKEPIINTFHPMPIAESDMISNDPVDPMPARSTTAWLNDLSDEAVDILLAHVGTPGAFIKAEIRLAGGAISKVSDEQSAYDYRSKTLLLQCVGIAPVPEAVQGVEAATSALKQSLKAHLSEGVYMNFLEGEEAQREIAHAFATEKYQRLSALKAQYDPDNLFSFGYNFQAKSQ